MTATQQENIKIKQALKKEFPAYRITVRQDRGTASGWKCIGIETDFKAEREDREYASNGLYIGGRYKQEISEKFRAIEKRAKEIVRQNCELYTYCADDGYNTERDCLLIDVKGFNNPF